MSPKRSCTLALLLVVAMMGSVSCATGAGGAPTNGGGTGSGSAFRQPCEAFCQRLRALGCKEGEPLASGTSCETFCIDTQEAGHDLKIACVLKIQSCGEMQSCNR
jgi:hypothetical protein